MDSFKKGSLAAYEILELAKAKKWKTSTLGIASQLIIVSLLQHTPYEARMEFLSMIAQELGVVPQSKQEGAGIA